MTQNFITKSKIIHGDKYDYTDSVYIDCKTKININCYIHGQFKQLSTEHIRGRGCKICGIISSSSKHTKSKEIFVKNPLKFMVVNMIIPL